MVHRVILFGYFFVLGNSEISQRTKSLAMGTAPEDHLYALFESTCRLKVFISSTSLLADMDNQCKVQYAVSMQSISTLSFATHFQHPDVLVFSAEVCVVIQIQENERRSKHCGACFEEDIQR